MGKQIQVVDEAGCYQEEAVLDFVRSRGIAEAGVKYSTVAIMGPQSSGKSTLLNHLFGTDFKMMNALVGRAQTTRGVWLDLSNKVTEPPTMVMDLEGSDGVERGEDDTTFERQSALFALATADVLMINMFAVNIGRVQGSGTPLLKTIFQVNLKLFQSATTHRTVLLLVIRDRTSTPHEVMCNNLRKDLAGIWASLVKAPELTDSTLEDFFDLQFVSLPNYETQQADFVGEASELRDRFTSASSTSLLPADDTKVPASALSVHMQQIWRVITEQKDLDLPAHKVMVASIRCKDIAREQLEAITSDQAWSKLLAAATAGSEVHSSFRADAAALVESCLFGYDSDAMYFVDSVRSEQKRDLEAALYGALHGAYAAQATLLRMQLAAEFRAALEAEAARPEHRVQAVAAEKLPEFLEKYEQRVREMLLLPDSGWPLGDDVMAKDLAAAEDSIRSDVMRRVEQECMEEAESTVDGAGWQIITALPADLWARLRSLVKQALMQIIQLTDKELDGYGAAESEVNALRERIAVALSTKLVKSLRRHLQQLPRHLEARFVTAFEEEDGVRRPWTSNLKEDAARARSECAQVLAQLPVVPSGLHVPGVQEGELRMARESVLEFAAYEEPSVSDADGSAQRAAPALLTSTRWSSKVAPEAVLLSPAEVRETWHTFKQHCKAVVRRAMELQEERRRANRRPLPLWVIPCIIFFGWNEVTSLLRNPILFVCCVMALLFFYQLYRDLDVDAEMEKGLPAAAINIGRRLWPTSRQIFANTFDAAKQLAQSALSGQAGHAQGNGAAAGGATPYSTPSAPTPAPRTPVAAPFGASSPAPGQLREVELSPLMNSPVEGLRKRVGSGEPTTPSMRDHIASVKEQ